MVTMRMGEGQTLQPIFDTEHVNFNFSADIREQNSTFLTRQISVCTSTCLILGPDKTN